MAESIKLNEASVRTALSAYSTALETTVSAMEDFVNAVSSSPYVTGTSAAANPLSSYMQGLTLDYLSPLKGSLANIVVAMPAAITTLQERDSSLAQGQWGGK